MRHRAFALASSIGLAVAAAVVAAPAVAPAVAGGGFTPAVGATPHVRYAGKPVAVGGNAVFDCQLHKTDFPCYGPAQITHAYQIDPTGLTGAGRTIVIIDAFQDPFITRELHDFDTVWGLPDPPSFDIVAPDGLTPFDFNDENMVGWSGEIALDVQWAHAVAPAAKIVLVLAKSNNDPDIVSAEAYAIHNNLGDVMSMSFGEGEICFDASLDASEHALFAQATAQGITLVASSGDDGAAQPGCTDPDTLFLSTSTPAADPYVLGVGGTNLTANLTSGAYKSEAAWNDCCGQSGGGFSVRYPRPQYQNGFNNRSGRGVPDVAYNAGVFGGVITAWYVLDGAVPPPGQFGSFFIFGGTSAGAPQWSAITALADQKAGHRVGWLNPTLYSLAQTKNPYTRDFHDITAGDNIVAGIGGFSTTTGWDPVTGLGTPVVFALLKDIS